MSIWGCLAKKLGNPWPNVSVEAAVLLKGLYMTPFCVSVKWLIIPFSVNF